MLGFLSLNLYCYANDKLLNVQKLVAAWRVGLNSVLKYHVGQKIKVKLITCSTTGQNILDIVQYFHIQFHKKIATYNSNCKENNVSIIR
jgi:hypothetical protein